MMTSKIIPSEQTGIVLTRRSFLGWTGRLGIVAVTTQIIPVQSLNDLECIPCNITASNIIRLEKIACNEYMFRAELWSRALKEALLDQFEKVYYENTH